MRDYKEYFLEIVQDLRNIGGTTNNFPIYAISLYKKPKTPFTNTNFENISNSSSADVKISANFSNNYTETRQIIQSEVNDRPNFLITSGFRGSDYISVSMGIYMLKYFFYQYMKNDSTINYILENAVLWFIF